MFIRDPKCYNDLKWVVHQFGLEDVLKIKYFQEWVAKLGNVLIVLSLLLSLTSKSIPTARVQITSQSIESNPLALPQFVTAISENFSTDPNTNGKWGINHHNSDLSNEAPWDSTNQTLYLTRAVGGIGVAAFADYQLIETEWEAQFRYKAGGGSGNGMIRLNVVDDNSIVDVASNPLGGVNVGDGDFTGGEMYTVNKTAGTCGTGTWTYGNLELHHINIGQGDSTLIVGPTGKSLLFDAGDSYWNSSIDAQTIGPYIESVLGCKELDYVAISHFQADHIGYVGYGGLYHLVETQGFTVGSTLIRDYNSYLGETSSTFTNWKTYLEGAGQAKLHPVTAIEGTSQVDLGTGVTFDIVTVDGNGAIIAGDFSSDASPPSENDYSIGAVISYGDFDEWIGGDLSGQYEVSGFGYAYHDIELSVAPEVGDVDVYRVNHHGSSHSSSATFVNQIDPEVSIISVGNANTYGHPTQSVMDRLLATSDVYLTERGNINTDIGSAVVAGNIIIKTSDGLLYTVNGIPYTATEPTRTDVDGDGYFAEADPDDGDNGITPAPNGGCGPIYQTCSISCEVGAGDVLINEVLPSPSSGPEWVELYNTTNSTVNIGYCYIDDITAGSAAYQISAGALIPAHGFWTLDRTSYFNNTGDDVRFLKEDNSTVLDSFSFGSTDYDLSWYRLPDGEAWAGSPTASTTKGYSNVISASIDTIIGGNSANYTLSSGESIRESYSGVNDGPVQVVSNTAGVDTLASQRVIYGGRSYSETMGNPNNLLTNEYIFPWYNNVAMSSQLRVSNLGGVSTTIQVYLGSDPTPIDEYTLAAGAASRKSYSGRNEGPLRVTSSATDILTTIRVLYAQKSYSELTGFPINQLANEYIFPWYNNTAMSSQLRVSNLGGVSTTIQVYLGSDPNPIDEYTLAAGAASRKSYSEQSAGPLRVTSSATDILTTIRVLYAQKSYSELTGFPVNQLTNEYWYPVYDNVALGSQLRVSNLGSVSTTIRVYLGSDPNPIDDYTLAAGAASRKSYTGLSDGPLHVTSSATDILTTIRYLYSTAAFNSYYEMTGLPKEQLTFQYWFPWYNNTAMNSQLRIAVP